MPGPCSAPNGNVRLVNEPKLREKLRAAGKLRTGKTETKRK